MEVYHIFPQSLQENVGIVFWLGYDRFLPHPFQFIIQQLSHHLMLHVVGNTAHIHTAWRAQEQNQLKVLPWHLPAGNKEGHQKPQHSWYPWLRFKWTQGRTVTAWTKHVDLLPRKLVTIPQPWHVVSLATRKHAIIEEKFSVWSMPGYVMRISSSTSVEWEVRSW
jgi:hypothetical protein